MPNSDDNSWISDMVRRDLQNPETRKASLQALQRILEADRRDPSVYRIQLGRFSSKRYFKQILAVLEAELSSVSGIEIKKDHSLGFIVLSFHTLPALDHFKSRLPLGWSTSDDCFQFSESRRDPESGRWEEMSNPVMHQID